MTSFMVANAEIERLLYIKGNKTIAHSLGVSEERVAQVREAARKPVKLAPVIAPEPIRLLPDPLERIMAEPISREAVLTPNLCPTCGAPVKGRLMITHIQALVAAYYKTPVREMTSDRRNRSAVYPRQVAMYLAYEATPKSLTEIGRRFGNRDHTTVIHAIRAVQQRMLDDAEIEADVKALRERLAA